MNPNGKVALITGAASGIGFSIAKALLENGAKGIAVLDVNSTDGKTSLEKLGTEFGNSKVIFIKTDVTIIKEFENAFKQTINTFGQLDIVVNNAGILKEEDYITEMNINMGGTCNGIMLGLKYLSKDKTGKGGVIVNMSSISAVGAKHVYPMYAATKSGILALTQGWGHPFHCNRTGVRIVALCPSSTQTPLLGKIKVLEECAEERNKLIESMPMQKPEAVANSAVHVIKQAETASAWLIEDSKLYKLNFPDWKDCKELVVDNIA